MLGEIRCRARLVVLRQAPPPRCEHPGPDRPHPVPGVDLPDRARSTHDITAARKHALPALYPAAAAGLPTLADKGYTGARIGIHVPLKGADLPPDNKSTNLLITALRAPAERANAILKSSWRALRRITLCPWRIGHIVAAALVLSTMERGRW